MDEDEDFDNDFDGDDSDGDDDWEDDDDYYDDDGDFVGEQFADPGGESALRAASPTNPRNLPCPTCGTPNVLTPKDRSLGYQCDRCAEQRERGY